MKTKAKYITALIVVVALVLVLAAFMVRYFMGQHRQQPVSQPQVFNPKPGQSLPVVKNDVPKNVAPQGFPADIPIESGATITQNYNATAPNGMFQATREFQTKQSLGQNFALYSNYFASSGWKITNSLNLANVKILNAKKGNANLQITIFQNTTTKQNSISISYTSSQ